MSLANELLHLLGDDAGIGHDTYYGILACDAITYAVGGVVRHVERHDSKLTKLVSMVFLNDFPISRRDLTAHTFVEQNAVVNFCCGIHWEVPVVGQ